MGSLRLRRNFEEQDDERLPHVFRQSLDGTLRFTGSLTTAATFRVALGGVLRFAGSLTTIFMAAPGGVVNILRQLNRRGHL